MNHGTSNLRRRTCVLAAFVFVFVLTVLLLETSFVVLSTTNIDFDAPPASTLTLAAPVVDRHWCPRASCPTDLHCSPCQRRFLIILTTGRSASTTLTWMMDALPGVRMSGENNNAVTLVRDMWTGVLAEPFRLDLPRSRLKGAWGHNPIPGGSIACVAQPLFEVLNPPPRNPLNTTVAEEDMIIGFKTIRLQKNLTSHEIPRMAKFLRSAFPCARYLVNIRSDQQALVSSMGKAFKRADHNSSFKQAARETMALQELWRELSDQAFLLDSSEWTQNVSLVNEAVTWLGFHQSCAFQQLLEFNKGRKVETQRLLQTTRDPAEAHQNHEGSPPQHQFKETERDPLGPAQTLSPPHRGRRRLEKRWKKNYHHGRTNAELPISCRYSP